MDFGFLKMKIPSNLAIFFIFLVLIFICYSGLFLNFSTKIPGGDHPDVINILSIINFTMHAPIKDIYHFPIFYPESYMLARTHPLFGVSFFFKIFHSLGFNLNQSYNLYIIVSLIIGAFGCYLLAREISKSEIFAFLFSTIYILHQMNTLFFVWLNFLSVFYVPYVFYFLIRFFKTKRRIFIIGAVLFALMQIMASLYYGAILWGLLIPLFLIAALILKIISLKDFKQSLFYLFIGLILILLIFSPFLTITQPEQSESDGHSLVTALDLFYYSKIISKIFGFDPKVQALYFFPGFSFLLFILFFIVSFIDNKKYKNLLFLFLAVLSVLLTCFVFLNNAASDWLFLAFLGITASAVIAGWKNMDKWTKLVTISLAFFMLFFISFPHIPLLKTISLFDVFSKVMPVQGLRAIRRICFICLPFLITIAAIGGARSFKLFEDFNKKKKFLFIALILSLMIVENIRLEKQKKRMTELQKPSSDVYKLLPFNKDKIILEIPFYFGFNQPHNSAYTLSWSEHRNLLLNGFTPNEPFGYIHELSSILGRYQNNFPSEEKLRNLINKYSVTHVIFHWDRIHDETRDLIRTRVNQIKKFGKIVYRDEKNTILRTQEYIPIKNIIRTYSLYHLRKKRIEIVLYETYSGRITIRLNNRLVRRRELNSERIHIDLKHWPMSVSGNRIEVNFKRPVRLKAMELIE